MSEQHKIVVIRKLLDLKKEVNELRFKAIMVEGKFKGKPIDTSYTKILKLFVRIIENQIDQINKS